MSWAAHQFEIYAVQAHLPKKMRGKVSFFGIFLGDFTPGLPVEVLGVRHHHRRSPLRRRLAPPVAPRVARDGLHPHDVPRRPHRRGAVGVEAQPRAHRRLHPRLRRPRAHRRERQRGDDAAVPVHHAELDAGDLGLRRDQGRRQVPRRGGVLQQPRAWSMDLFWLVVVLCSWRVLTREYWRTQIVPADPHIWSWLGQRLPERALARDLPGHVLLRGVPAPRVVRVGARVRHAGHRRREATRLPVRPVLDGTVVARRAIATARAGGDRDPGDARPCSASSTGRSASSGSRWAEPNADRA